MDWNKVRESLFRLKSLLIADQKLNMKTRTNILLEFNISKLSRLRIRLGFFMPEV